MLLSEFFALAEPMLKGTLEREAATASMPDVDTERWALYGDFCAAHRSNLLAAVFPLSRERLGADVWRALELAYFSEHPCQHWELNQNAAQFSEWIERRGPIAAPGLPAWAWELCDCEWWDYAIFSAEDEPDTSGAHSALAPALMLRAYAHNILA